MAAHVLVANVAVCNRPIASVLPGRVGVERSKVQVQFRDISYEAEVLIGSSGLPSVGNSFKKLLQVGVVTAN